MRFLRLAGDQAAASAIEFAMTLPIFLFVFFAVIEGGLLMWTQLGLQNGVEKAARCASINTALCGNASAVQNYAARYSYGLNPPPSVFSLTNAACGNQVSASFTYKFFTYVFRSPSITLTAQSCFPSS
jgi:TadE-like protein